MLLKNFVAQEVLLMLIAQEVLVVAQEVCPMQSSFSAPEIAVLIKGTVLTHFTRSIH